MEKLKKIITQYGRWSELSVYIDRIEAHIDSDFSHSLENAKALLEAIGKNICLEKGYSLVAKPNLSQVLKGAFRALGHSNESLVTQMSTSLANIGQQIGTLRNDIGATAHGKSLDEIKERNNSVDILTRDMLIDSVVVVSSFLIRIFEYENPRITSKPETKTLSYAEAEDFNDFWDDSFGEFNMGDYSFTASEILFNLDNQAYLNEYKTFQELEQVEDDDE